MDTPVADAPAPKDKAAGHLTPSPQGAADGPWGSYVGETGAGGHKHGRGVQKWSDGSRYQGQFANNLKEGTGVYTWPNGEVYQGSFYKDSRHGEGVYCWPGGSRFVGKFYLNEREGYGTQYFPDGTVFQGLYRRGERFGPGVATYPDGRQDVGMWHQGRLFRLCHRLPGGFMLRDFPEVTALFPPPPGPAELLLHPHSKLPDEESSTLPAVMKGFSLDLHRLPTSQELRAELDQHFFGGQSGNPDVDPTLPILLQMQAHVHRHRFQAEALDWDVTAIMSDAREWFGPKGPLEEGSEQLILGALHGDRQCVRRTLKGGAVHPDVGDSHGHTALIAAAMNCHEDVIQLLLDCGAEVNQLTAEGVSALSACHVLYYSALLWPKATNVHPPQSSHPQDGLENSVLTSEATVMDCSNRVDRVDAADHQQGASNTGSAQDLEKDPEFDLETEPGWDDRTFQSTRSLVSLPIQVTEEALQRSAEALSHLGLVPLRPTITRETVREMALKKARHRGLSTTIDLLLSRGADPNVSCVPVPVLFLAVEAGDVQGLGRLLEFGARTDVTLPPERWGLYPLHIAAGLRGPAGPNMVEMLLSAMADPNARAKDAHEVFRLDEVPGDIPSQDGRTPLHVACQRDTDYTTTRDVVRLLLSHKSDTSLLWSGHSALSLAIASGNDLAVDELLAGGADPNLVLAPHVGSALCAATNLNYAPAQHLWSRTKLVEKLVKAGANILLPVMVGDGCKATLGTAVDFAYHSYQQDWGFTYTPYPTLDPVEKEIFRDQHQLLAQMGDLLREAAVQMERQQLEQEQSQGIYSIGPSHKFLYTGAGARPPSQTLPGAGPRMLEQRKPLFQYCYHCGRSVGVTLTPCSRCREVNYCSETCKLKAWSNRHCKECVRLPGGAKCSNRRCKKGSGSMRTGLKVVEKKKVHQDVKENYSFI
ncbi:ankyrin repeat and MYND domain-containing protein 1 [Arapaima gigas]